MNNLDYKQIQYSNNLINKIKDQVKVKAIKKYIKE